MNYDSIRNMEPKNYKVIIFRGLDSDSSSFFFLNKFGIRRCLFKDMDTFKNDYMHSSENITLCDVNNPADLYFLSKNFRGVLFVNLSTGQYDNYNIDSIEFKNNCLLIRYADANELMEKLLILGKKITGEEERLNIANKYFLSEDTGTETETDTEVSTRLPIEIELPANNFNLDHRDDSKIFAKSKISALTFLKKQKFEGFKYVKETYVRMKKEFDNEIAEKKIKMDNELAEKKIKMDNELAEKKRKMNNELGKLKALNKIITSTKEFYFDYNFGQDKEKCIREKLLSSKEKRFEIDIENKYKKGDNVVISFVSKSSYYLEVSNEYMSSRHRFKLLSLTGTKVSEFNSELIKFSKTNTHIILSNVSATYLQKFKLQDICSLVKLVASDNLLTDKDESNNDNILEGVKYSTITFCSCEELVRKLEVLYHEATIDKKISEEIADYDANFVLGQKIMKRIKENDEADEKRKETYRKKAKKRAKRDKIILK